jgi:hypothetical protein
MIQRPHSSYGGMVIGQQAIFRAQIMGRKIKRNGTLRAEMKWYMGLVQLFDRLSSGHLLLARVLTNPVFSGKIAPFVYNPLVKIPLH